MRPARIEATDWTQLVRPYRPCSRPSLAPINEQTWPTLAQPTRRQHTTAGQHTERGLSLTPYDHPRRYALKILGRANAGPNRGLIGLAPADARYHLHIVGSTGVGKSTWLANYALGEAEAGRGIALIDCQGDLSRNLLDRLPTACADRLVILDPDEQHGPAYNPLKPDREDPTGQAAEWAGEHVVGVFRALYASSWGARMEDYLRGACLTLSRRPGSSVPDIVNLLTDATFRAQVLDEYGTPDGLGTLWDDFEALTVTGRANLIAPLITRLRGVLSRRFARQLLSSPTSNSR